MPRIGPMEIVIILVIVLLIFGVGKLPQVGKSIGEGIRNFRKASGGEDEKDAAKAVEATKPAETATEAPQMTAEEQAEFKKWRESQEVKTSK